METNELDLVVLAEHKGIVRQVVLTNDDINHLRNFLVTLFISTGRKFQLMDKPLNEIELKKGD